MYGLFTRLLRGTRSRGFLLRISLRRTSSSCCGEDRAIVWISRLCALPKMSIAGAELAVLVSGDTIIDSTTLGFGRAGAVFGCTLRLTSSRNSTVRFTGC